MTKQLHSWEQKLAQIAEKNAGNDKGIDLSRPQMHSPTIRPDSLPKKKVGGGTIIGLLLLSAAAITMRYNFPQLLDLSNVNQPPAQVTLPVEEAPIAVVENITSNPPSFISPDLVRDIVKPQFAIKQDIRTSFIAEGRKISVHSAFIPNETSKESSMVFVEFRDGTNTYGATALKYSGDDEAQNIWINYPTIAHIKELKARISLKGNMPQKNANIIK